MTASATPQSANGADLGDNFALSGCRPFPLSVAEMADYDGHYEYWEAGVAWELRDTSMGHEMPSARLAKLLERIASIRGMPIDTFGTADLQERDARGARLRAAQADQLVYLDWHYELPGVLVVGDFPLPDVVFEVDLTTDIRDRKLDVYAAWGVPELWVDVPEADMPSKRKRPGMTIHLLDDGAFRQCAESAAFPTLTAQEIHAALNEPRTSSATVAAVRRVGEIMGRRSGTGPDDDPWLGPERRASRLLGRREGKAEGLAEGKAQGRAARRDERMAMIEGLLGMRGIRVEPRLRAEADRIGALPWAALLRAATESTDLDDFLARLPADPAPPRRDAD